MEHYLSFKKLEDTTCFLFMGPYSLLEIAERDGITEAERMTKACGKAVAYSIVTTDTDKKQVHVSA